MVSIVMEFDFGEAGENIIGGVKKLGTGVGQAIGTGTGYVGQGLQKLGQYAQEGGQLIKKNPLTSTAILGGAAIGGGIMAKRRKQSF